MAEINDSELNNIRRQLNQIDGQLLALLEARAELIKQVTEIKKRKGLPIRDKEREEEIIQSKASKTELPEEFVRQIYQAIIDASSKLEGEK